MNEFDEVKQLLRRNLEVSRESLKILKKLHRARKVALGFKIFYWVLFIAMIFGAYYYVQPLIGNFVETFDKVKADLSSLQKLNLPSL